MAAFISIVKYLNDQSSLLPSQAASSQASSAREPLNSQTLLASRSAISSELAWLEPVKIIKRKPARAWRSFSKSSMMRSKLPHSHSATNVHIDQQTVGERLGLVFEPSDIVEPFSKVSVGFFYFISFRTDFEFEFSANLAQFGLDGFGPLRIGPRFDDFKIVEALPDRAHDFGFSGHFELQSFLSGAARDAAMAHSAPGRSKVWGGCCWIRS